MEILFIISLAFTYDSVIPILVFYYSWLCLYIKYFEDSSSV